MANGAQIGLAGLRVLDTGFWLWPTEELILII
jgi:hypothetical protein